ncbi:MAG TPA: hypothetical protein VN085_11535 [Vicinamibacterales bacterium]|nr:hypothetical protein [Vicinamibacterales bacterium]
MRFQVGRWYFGVRIGPANVFVAWFNGQAEYRADYLEREINLMRRVMQDAGTWDDFCRAYATYKERRSGQAEEETR